MQETKKDLCHIGCLMLNNSILEVIHLLCWPISEQQENFQIKRSKEHT